MTLKFQHWDTSQDRSVGRLLGAWSCFRFPPGPSWNCAARLVYRDIFLVKVFPVWHFTSHGRIPWYTWFCKRKDQTTILWLVLAEPFAIHLRDPEQRYKYPQTQLRATRNTTTRKWAWYAGRTHLGKLTEVMCQVPVNWRREINEHGTSSIPSWWVVAWSRSFDSDVEDWEDKLLLLEKKLGSDIDRKDDSHSVDTTHQPPISQVTH